MKYLPWNLGAFGGHKVAGHYSSKGNSIIVGSEVTHYTYRAHIGECCKVLTQVLVHPSLGNFLTINCVSILNDFYLLSSYLANNTNTEARTWERLTIYQIFRNLQLTAGLTNLILKEKTKWLHNFLKVYIIRQAAYIMMGFNYCRLSKATLNYIRINSTLYQEVNSTNFLGLFLKYTDKLLTDNLTLCLWLSYTLELFIEALLGIYPDKVQIIRTIWAKNSLHLIPFILTEKAVVNEYTGKLLANSLRKKNSCHRGIYATGESTQCLAATDLLLQLLNCSCHKGIHAPVTGTFTNLVDKVTEHLGAFNGMKDLWMELYSINLTLLILHTSYRAYRSISGNLKALRSFGNIIGMTHPTDSLAGNAIK